jgi:GNAT superfamily N-acetyltransferase
MNSHNYSFRECTDLPDVFFSILPEEWRESIEPFWPAYRDSARIFVLESGEEVLGGGIVFSSVSPDTEVYRAEAQSWFDRGHLYIGFLWIDEKYRGQGLGSRWLTKLKEQFPRQKWWLSIEDFGLAAFYERSGFRGVKKVEGTYGEEWIMAD